METCGLKKEEEKKGNKATKQGSAKNWVIPSEFERLAVFLLFVELAE